MSPESPTPPPGESRGSGRFGSDQGWPRWTIFVLVAVVLGAIGLQFLASSTSSDEISYGEFITKLQDNEVKDAATNNADATFDNTNGNISGTLDRRLRTSPPPGRSSRPTPTCSCMTEKGVDFSTPTSRACSARLLPLLLPVALLIGFFVWMQRRAQGQMGGDHVHRPQPRPRPTPPRSPGTTFADVAGYDGVKQEITEVVDFLKNPERVRRDRRPHPQGRAARRPARAPARRSSPGPSPARPACRSCRSPAPTSWRCSSASAPAASATCSRPPASMGRAIIFVDEIDSIGRKRGAGLGGGHDEREQTLNQMLAEMDGFEATEGIVMMAATNRPDILDPALLRPGRFDRQIVVPLPELDERVADPRGARQATSGSAADVDLDVVARGTPGMSGADLANLVNEAALFAVRARRDEIHTRRLRGGPRPGAHGPAARVDGALRRGEGGHRLPRGRPRRAAPPCSPTPTRCTRSRSSRSGMALGVTQQLPVEERHIYRQDYIEDSPRRAAWAAASPRSSCSASSPPAPTTTSSAPPSWPARWCASGACRDRVGPMAWGSQGAVFLGEDLMHTRDYSDETARVIDEEVERILREQEERCRETLTEHRDGLDLVARALLEHETIDGAEVTRLVELARAGSTSANPHSVAAMSGPSGNGNGSGADGFGGPAGFPSVDPPPRPEPGSSPPRRPNSTGPAHGLGHLVACGPAPGWRVRPVRRWARRRSRRRGLAVLRGRARLAGLGHRGPQVGGGDRAEEVRRARRPASSATSTSGTASMP